jgi:hypothetical protein
VAHLARGPQVAEPCFICMISISGLRGQCQKDLSGQEDVPDQAPFGEHSDQGMGDQRSQGVRAGDQGRHHRDELRDQGRRDHLRGLYQG